jgi:hypothetical protein
LTGAKWAGFGRHARIGQQIFDHQRHALRCADHAPQVILRLLIDQIGHMCIQPVAKTAHLAQRFL